MNLSGFAVGTLLRWATNCLRNVTDRPNLEAEILLAHLLSCQREHLLTHPELKLTDDQYSSYTQWVTRRAAGEPLPYIVGHAHFCGLEFVVMPDVLIPRPETELLVEKAEAWMRDHPVQRLVDVGTGSGCIAVMLALRAPGVEIYATDISSAALCVARSNAVRHGVAERITFWEGDLWPSDFGPVDLIISNPPYVTEAECESLPLSVCQEPRAALWAGPDGLSVIRPLIRRARDCLQPRGVLLMEIGEKQGSAVLAMAQAAFPKAQVQILCDLSGKERILSLHKAPDLGKV